MKHLMLSLLVLLAALVATPLAPAQDAAGDDARFAANYDYIAFETSHGTIRLLLDKQRAPISSQNFLKYVESGFYDGTVFHRVIPTFVVQGGGYDATLGMKVTRVPIKNEWKNKLKNVRGSLSMARTSAHDSATSQFFINVVDNAMLDTPRDGAAYAVFGYVIEGMDAVDKIRDVKTAVRRTPNGPMQDVPIDPMPSITKGSIIKWADLSDSAKADVRKWDAMAAGWHDAAAQEEIRKNVEKAKEEVRILAERQEAIDKRFAEVTAALAADNVLQHEAGFAYVDQVVGDGPYPGNENPIVIVKAQGWLPDGQVWWRTDDEPQKQQQFPLPALSGFKGLQKAILTMQPGGTRVMRLPASLAFGDNGLPARGGWPWVDVPPGSDVILDITLVGFGEEVKIDQSGQGKIGG